MSTQNAPTGFLRSAQRVDQCSEDEQHARDHNHRDGGPAKPSLDGLRNSNNKSEIDEPEDRDEIQLRYRAARLDKL